MAVLSSVIGRGTLAGRPAAGRAGRLYFATDAAGTMYRDNGSSWDSVETSASGMTNPMTTQGDIIYGGASGSPTRLGIGTAGQVLKVNAGATAPEWGAASGGGATHSYLGYNTVGGSNELMQAQWMYCQQVTPAASGLLLGISAHLVQGTADSVAGFVVGVWEDSGSNTVGQLIAIGGDGGGTVGYYKPTSGGLGTAEWLHWPICIYLTGSAKYWIGIIRNASGSFNIYYDGSGSDRTIATGGGTWVADGGRYTQTDSTKKYSLRASFLS